MDLDKVWTVVACAAVASTGLVVGAVVGSVSRLSHRTIAQAMSVTAGLLLATASVSLANEAMRTAGPVPTLMSLLLGAAGMSAADAVLARWGARHRKRCGDCVAQPSEAEQPGSGVAIAVGTALDGIPEALVLGLALRRDSVPADLLLAIAVGNLPEALSGAAGMRSAGRSRRYILLLWGAIAVGAAAATCAGYVTLGSLGPLWTSRLQAFGAGALLAMVAETMIPEAFHNSPRFSGFTAALGFSLVLLMAALGH